MDSYEYISGYYDNYDEDGRLDSCHGRVEFLTTLRYIEKYLQPDAKILEIGAGTGKYSHALARRGYDVTAVELVPHNIELFKANSAPDERVSVYEGNATALDMIPSDRFDITLLLGPMYHLFTAEDKIAAISEALRVTKRGGVVFAAYCIADASVICYGFVSGNIRSAVETGLIDPLTFKCSSSPKEIFELWRKEEIDRLMSRFDVERLHYIGTDMATNFIRPTVDAMDDETFGLYLRYHFSICERPELVGATHHSLDVFRKR